MSFKTISLTLPEKMIQQIDEMLLKRDFTSRSDFFRHLVRMWFMNEKDEPHEEVEEEPEEIDLEFGIPPEVIEEIKEKAKLIN